MKINQLKDKKIAIVGFGQEGKSLANFLKKKKIKEIFILDEKRELKVPAFFKKQLGENYLRNLSEFDLVFLSPGISSKRKEFERCQEKISSATELFFDNFPGKIIGVTGTKGKGTTARLVYRILKKAKSREKVFLGGNIGKPLISFLEKADKKTIMIAELSSFQLQNLKKSPQISLLTNLDKDHLDYHSSLKEYQQVKLNIFRFQKKKDLAIADLSLKKRVEKINQAKKLFFSLSNKKSNAFFENGWLKVRIKNKERKILSEKEIKLPGRHLKKDILGSVLLASSLRIKKEVIAKIVKSYRPDKHRLEKFFQKEKIIFYNDSSATNPLAAVEAIKSFSLPMILILGGKNKGFDYQKLCSTIKKKNKLIKLVILFGENKDQLKKLLPKDIKKIILSDFKKIGQEIKKNLSFDRGIVLFSPAASSLDCFENYQERGRVFKKIIRKTFG